MWTSWFHFWWSWGSTSERIHFLGTSATFFPSNDSAGESLGRGAGGHPCSCALKSGRRFLQNLCLGRCPPNMSPARDCGDLCSQRGDIGQLLICGLVHGSPPESGLVNLLLPPAEGRDLREAMGWKGPGPPNRHVEVACHLLQHFSWIHDCVRNLTSPSLKFFVLLK